MTKTTFLVVLKNRHFLKLWLSQALSQLTANMLNFILIVKVYEATGSTVAVGLLLALYVAPSLFLGLFAGAFIDLWSKRKILVITNLAQALIVLLYLGIGSKIWPIYSIVLLYSICDEFFNPTQAALLPALVKKDHFPAANSFFFFTLHGAFLIGYSIGGPIIKTFGMRSPFLLASFFLWMATLATFFLPKDKPRKKWNIERGFGEIAEDVKEGYSFIKNEPRVLIPIGLYVLTQILLATVVILFPSYSQNVLGIDIRDAGLVLILPAGLGAIMGSILVERLIKKLGKRILITSGIFGAAFGLLSLALIVPLVPMASQFASLTMVLLGMTAIMINIPAQTMLQENTPFNIRGRVFGVLGALVTVAAAIPVFVTAALVDILGVNWIVFIISILTFTLGFLSLRKKYVLQIYHRSGNTR
ncbi:MAG: MFS transporter [Candidatus Marinimicrobia bacterium]|nr:MFS transporter [Candidatus Neomarinimicrobiota bacterium]